MFSRFGLKQGNFHLVSLTSFVPGTPMKTETSNTLASRRLQNGQNTSCVQKALAERLALFQISAVCGW